MNLQILKLDFFNAEYDGQYAADSPLNTTSGLSSTALPETAVKHTQGYERFCNLRQPLYLHL